MTSEPSTLVILGASGDLTERLLLPGLGSLVASDRGRRIQLIGTGRSARTPQEWTKTVKAAFDSVDATGRRAAGIVSSTKYIQADPTDLDDLTRILDACEGAPALYFALPPAISIQVCEQLAKLDLPEGTTLALEKPFGSNSRSAAQLNRQLLKLVPEDRIHRTDHFLGLSTVLNLVSLRFANRFFESVWSAKDIEKVEILYDETLALEGRAAYYDKSGALVDMIQSHLLQVLAVFAMEPPASIDPDDLRSNIASVLRATEVWDNDPIAHSRRARYTGATVDGTRIPAYAKEDGVDPANETETLAEVTFGVANARWAGVPFRLRSGKALKEASKRIVVTFKPVAHLPRGLHGPARPDRLIIDLKPDGISLEVTMDGTGEPFTLTQSTFRAEFAEPELTPYGEVLDGILAGDPRLSVRGDVAERCWRIVAPVMRAWKGDRVPMAEYRAGSAGPTAWR